MRRTMVLVALLVGAGAAGAQRARPFEFRGLVGATMATGAMRDVMEDAALFSAQGAVQLRPMLHAVATFGWMPTRTQLDVSSNKVSVVQYDLGVELALARRRYEGGQLLPYVGLGAGARMYAYDAAELKDRTCTVGVGTLGAEWTMREVGLRAEVRDNVFCFRSPLPGGESRTRNDVGMSFGVVYHFW